MEMEQTQPQHSTLALDLSSKMILPCLMGFFLVLLLPYRLKKEDAVWNKQHDVIKQGMCKLVVVKDLIFLTKTKRLSVHCSQVKRSNYEDEIVEPIEDRPKRELMGSWGPTTVSEAEMKNTALSKWRKLSQKLNTR